MIGFKEWCAKLAPVAEAASKGLEIQWLSGGVWVEKEPASGFSVCHEYRIKPRTIMIGDMEIPEPMRETPEECASVFIVDISCGGPDVNLAIGANYRENYHRAMLDRGLIHSSQDGAITHSKALIALTAKK